jgi:hypothetical protein
MPKDKEETNKNELPYPIHRETFLTVLEEALAPSGRKNKNGEDLATHDVKWMVEEILKRTPSEWLAAKLTQSQGNKKNNALFHSKTIPFSAVYSRKSYYSRAWDVKMTLKPMRSVGNPLTAEEQAFVDAAEARIKKLATVKPKTTSS